VIAFANKRFFNSLLSTDCQIELFRWFNWLFNKLNSRVGRCYRNGENSKELKVEGGTFELLSTCLQVLLYHCIEGKS
jgi:hypothetical protein